MESNKPYLLVIDKSTGARITSYVVGVHSDNMKDLKKIANLDYPGAIFIEDDGELQHKLVDDTTVYENGEVVIKLPEDVFVEEAAAENIEVDNATLLELLADLYEKVKGI